MDMFSSMRGFIRGATIGGNIRLPLEIMGVDKAQQDKSVKEVLELVAFGGL